MDATSALFAASLLLLAGIYGIYWLEGRRRGDRSSDDSAETKPAATNHTT